MRACVVCVCVQLLMASKDASEFRTELVEARMKAQQATETLVVEKQGRLRAETKEEDERRERISTTAQMQAVQEKHALEMEAERVARTKLETETALLSQVRRRRTMGGRRAGGGDTAAVDVCRVSDCQYYIIVRYQCGTSEYLLLFYFLDLYNTLYIYICIYIFCVVSVFSRNLRNQHVFPAFFFFFLLRFSFDFKRSLSMIDDDTNDFEYLVFFRCE